MSIMFKCMGKRGRELSIPVSSFEKAGRKARLLILRHGYKRCIAVRREVDPRVG